MTGRHLVGEVVSTTWYHTRTWFGRSYGMACTDRARAMTRPNITRSAPRQEGQFLSLSEAGTRWAEITGASIPLPSTVSRWCTQGVRGHKLPSHVSGGRVWVNEIDLTAFYEDLNRDRGDRSS